MPDFDDLRSEFESQPTVPEERMSEIAALVCKRSDRLESVLDQRDRQELFAAIFVAVCFGAAAIFMSAPLVKIGGLVVVVGCVEIVLVMRRARRPSQPDPMSLSLADRLQHEIEMVERQITLLKNVAWWYLAPIYLGACLFVSGLAWDWFAVFFAASYFIICLGIWKMNQTARRENLEPLRDRLVAAREAVANPDTADAIHNEVVQGLSEDTFGPAAAAADMTPEQAKEYSRQTLRAVGRFFDAVIVFVLMAWGGMVAGGMIDAVIAGKHPAEGEDGVFSMIGFFIAAAYSIWTKASNWTAMWKRNLR